jgi:hypothetical protein
MSEYKNEAGEWLMDGAAIRFEQQLDAEYAEQRYLDDDYYYRDDEDADCDPDYDLDLHNGHAWCWTHDQNLDVCEGENEPTPMEDQWLDSYMEDRITTMFE